SAYSRPWFTVRLTGFSPPEGTWSTSWSRSGRTRNTEIVSSPAFAANRNSAWSSRCVGDVSPCAVPSSRPFALSSKLPLPVAAAHRRPTPVPARRRDRPAKPGLAPHRSRVTSSGFQPVVEHLELEPRSGPKRAAELPHVAHEQLRLLHRGEVPAAVEFGPVR